MTGLFVLLNLNYFTLFSEYFVTISTFYVLIVTTLFIFNIYVLTIQKAVSECIALILILSCYFIYNDDIIYLSVSKPINKFLIYCDFYLKDFVSFNNCIKNDFLGFFAKLLICFFSALYFLLISNSLKEQKLTYLEYLIILLLAIISLLLMCNSYDLLTVYITIELSSLAFYILASFRKISSYSVEAGIKYFITGTISSAFFLLGSSIIYGFTGSISFVTFYDLFETNILWGFSSEFYIFDFKDSNLTYSFLKFLNNSEGFSYFLNNSFLEIGLVFILFSILIKLSAAPFHLWSLDVYEGSPTNSTIFFAVISKLSLFIVLVRIYYTSFFSFYDSWQHYVLWVGFLSIFVGSFGGLKQRKLKTLMSYSSTSHIGYSLVALSTSTFFGVQAVLFYMLTYMTSGLSLWSALLVLRLKRKNSLDKNNKELGELSSLRKSNFAIAFALSLTMFSISGIPPMLGFLAKMNLFLPIIRITYYLIAFISILTSVVSTFYYIRVIKVLHFENLLVSELYYSAKHSKTVILSVFVFLLIFLFITPTLLHIINYKAIFLLT